MSLKNGVLIDKLQSLDKTLAELRSLGEVTEKQLDDDWRTRRAIERDLQILVEIVVDVCQRIVSLSGQTPPTTGREAVERCCQLGALSACERYMRMVQFRNLIVHRYERIDGTILVEIVNERLGDFERFRQEIMKMSRTDRGDPAGVFASVPKVIAVWAFGSAERGAMTRSSDIDIGVLFDGPVSLDELAGLRAKLQEEFRFDDIDLVAVDDASTPILRFEVISGRSIYCRNPQRRAEFVSLAAREYEDEMAFLQRGMKTEDHS